MNTANTVYLGVFVWGSFLWSYNTVTKKQTFVWLFARRARPFRDVPGLSSKRKGDCTVGLGRSAKIRQKSVNGKASLPLLTCSSMSTPNLSDLSSFEIQISAGGWQLGTIRSTGASVGVPWVVYVVIRCVWEKKMRFKTFTSNFSWFEMVGIEVNEVIFSGGNIRDDGRVSKFGYDHLRNSSRKSVNKNNVEMKHSVTSQMFFIICLPLDLPDLFFLQRLDSADGEMHEMRSKARRIIQSWSIDVTWFHGYGGWRCLGDTNVMMNDWCLVLDGRWFMNDDWWLMGDDWWWLRYLYDDW